MAIVSSGINKPDSYSESRKERVVDPTPLKSENFSYKQDKLRPQKFNDYVGQNNVKRVLAIAVQAAIARGEALDHLLLYGPPGLGKTTMALVLAEELGVKCRIASAPALERPRDIVGLLVNLQPREVLFIDEIHRLTRVAEELLYSAMEDKRLDLTIGKSAGARARSIELSPFTLIGATTRAGALSSPLRDRFGLTQRLDFYSLDDLQAIVQRTAHLLGLSLTDNASIQLARRCRGTPRIANRLLKRVRDLATVRGEINLIDEALVKEALHLHEIDNQGLDSIDRRFLTLIIDKFSGGPVGLETLSAALGEDPITLETVIEPFLLQIGFLKRTPRGRVVNSNAIHHLKCLKLT